MLFQSRKWILKRRDRPFTLGNKRLKFSLRRIV